jgi:hypothetical protein
MRAVGESLNRARASAVTSGLTGVLLAILMAICCGLPGAASAAGPAKSGSTFATSFLTLPKGASPGGNSTFSDFGVDRSSISSDGRFVVFSSAVNSFSRRAHPDVSNVFRKDRQTGELVFVSRKSGSKGAGLAQSSLSARISNDGNLVAFLSRGAFVPEDVDGAQDVYIRNISTNQTTLATPNTTAAVFQFDFSADGQFIAFATPEALVGTDLNGDPDVFRRNLGSGVVNLVSRIQVSETSGNDYSDSPSISGDGRWVAFRSNATNLFGGFSQNNGAAPDLFARDMNGAATFLVSAAFNNPLKGGNGENSEPAIAGTPAGSNEVKVAYSSYSTDVAAGGVDASADSSVYLRSSLAAAPSTLISQSTGGQNANSRAHTPAISDNGNRILYSSDATNLGAGANYYGTYLRDVGAATTVLGSAENEYAIANDISGNGKLITWSERGGATPDSDLDSFGVFGRLVPGGPVRFLSRPPGARPVLIPGAVVDSTYDGNRKISGNGRFVVMNVASSRVGAGTKGSYEVIRRDLSNGRIQIVSRKSGKSGALSGGSAFPSISNDGTRVAFVSFNSLVAADSDDKSDAYVRDLKKNTTTLVSRADGAGGADADDAVESAAISGDGRRIVFSTKSSNLGVPGDKTKVFVRDTSTSKTILVSRATGQAGVPGNGDSEQAGINNNGQVVVFRSLSSNLDPADAETGSDIYVRNLAADTLVLVSRAPGLGGAASLGFDYAPAISGDGKVVAFRTDEEGLAPDDGPWPLNTEQVVSRVVATGANALVSRTAGGLIGDQSSDSPSINGDGSLIAFISEAENLLAGRGGENRDAVLVKNTKTGRISGPPAFGLKNNEPQQRSDSPSLSNNGRCLAFVGYGHNRASGDLSDFPSSYVYVVSRTCTNPRGIPKPRLSALRTSASVIRFRLNTRATVTISFERKKAGGGFAAAGKVIRKNQKAGRNAFRFNGRVGKKKLKKGAYRVTLSAKNSSGSSRKVRKALTIGR